MTGNFRMISTTLAAALLAGAFFGVPRTLAASEKKKPRASLRFAT